MSVKVKICGVTRIDDAIAAADLGADLIGLNFHPPSPRCISIERAIEIAEAVAGRAQIAGVFVNAAREYIDECRRAIGLAMIQFHGDENDAALAGWPIPVIRAIRLRPDEPAAEIARGNADYFLIDTYHPALFGGTGEAISVELLRRLDLRRAFIAGGLHPDNVASIAALQPHGVDAASGVESAPGIKDHDKLRRFIENAKSSR